jgi:hypothetical protein
MSCVRTESRAPLLSSRDTTLLSSSAPEELECPWWKGRNPLWSIQASGVLAHERADSVRSARTREPDLPRQLGSLRRLHRGCGGRDTESCRSRTVSVAVTSFSKRAFTSSRSANHHSVAIYSLSINVSPRGLADHRNRQGPLFRSVVTCTGAFALAPITFAISECSCVTVQGAESYFGSSIVM